MQSHRFDVFLCHQSQDKPAVREIDRKLIENGIQPWLDERNLRGGSVWQDELERLIGAVPAVAVFIGPGGRGPWQDLELRAFLDQFALRGCRMIPVILEGGEIHGLSPFLTQCKAIDFRETTPDPLVQLVMAIKGAQAGREGSETAARKLWTIPYRRNRYFVGREEILEHLRERLTRDGSAALGQTQAISGLGGIGKTQTAVEYAYRYRDEYRAVLFVRADTEAEIMTGFSELARELGLGEAQEQEHVAAAVLAWLKGNDGWLLIFDNADTPDLVKPFLPATHQGHVLVTSRARAFSGLGIGRPFRMPTLPLNEAVEFLLERSEREGTDLGDDERIACEELAQELGCLPLALEQAGSFIFEKQSRFQDYLRSYRKRGLELLERGQPQVEGHPEPVATTWSLNFWEVEETSSPSADVLRASAFLSPDEIPLEILMQGGSELGPTVADALAKSKEDSLVVDEILEPLTKYSLISRNVAAGTYSVHRLVQEVVKRDMKGQDRQVWAERVVRALNGTFPEVKLASWPVCDRLVAHVQMTLKVGVAKYRVELEEAGRLFNLAGIYLWNRARYGQAEPLYLRSLEIFEKALGKNHPEVAKTLNNLGLLYRVKGQNAEAEPLYLRSLEITKKTLGEDHPEVAQTLANLGLLYASQGRYAEAEPLYLRSLKITEKAVGEDHPDVAPTLNNLGILYRAQSRYADAEPLYVRSQEIFEKAHGKGHPEVAKTLNNLGLLYGNQGRYGEAEPLLRRSIEIFENALGKDHPHVHQALSNYADLLRATGREDEAAELEAWWAGKSADGQ